MYIYRQRTGEFADGEKIIASGYSGYGECQNRPEDQHRPSLGPIPQGAYLVGTESENNAHGPVALHLIPQTGTQTFGRSGFLMHGDSIEHPGAASHGCIILPRPIRERVRDGHDRLLVVIP